MQLTAASVQTNTPTEQPLSTAERPPAPCHPSLHCLVEAGLSQYIPIFQAHNLHGPILSTLSNADLRHDLGIRSLAHRRAVLAAIRPTSSSPSVPLFGSILVHLSNVRTFHSWLSNAVQAIVFALALVRLAPLITVPHLLDSCAAAVVAIAVACACYGAYVYFHVTQTVRNRELYHPDRIGAVASLLLSLAVAAIAVAVLLVYTLT